MAAEDFFSRWSQRKSQTDTAGAGQPASGLTEDVGMNPAAAPQPEEPLPPPTIDDVAQLTPDSDFSRFVKNDVDEAVKRSALKKLFTNPHFNVMDGLDVYIDDYNKFTPMTPALLASLRHAKDLLNPPVLKKPDAHSADTGAAAVPMEMLSSQDEVPASAASQVESADASTTEAAETAGNANPDAGSDTASSTETKAETSLPPTNDRAAEVKRMPGEQNKEVSSPQGDS